MTKKCFIILFLLLLTRLQSQNLIPNSSFEFFIDSIEFKGREFNLLFEDWKSPSGGTPDLYTTLRTGQYGAPKNWAGQLDPRSGNSYVGFGANFGGTDLFEYLSVKLNKPLIKDNYYCFSLYISSADNQIYSSNEIDYAVSKNPYFQKPMTIFKLNDYNRFIARKGFIPKNEWSFVSSCFKANGQEEYLICGILNHKYKRYKTTNTMMSKLDGLYFYIDDISLLQIKDTSECPCNELKTSNNYTLATQNSIVLKNITFETNKANLLPSSNDELNKLVSFLKSNSYYNIEIIGHTDNIGNENENLKLSEARSKAVGDFLINSGIPKTRITYKGIGSKFPIKTNDTEENRLLNRRVEIKMTKK